MRQLTHSALRRRSILTANQIRNLVRPNRPVKRARSRRPIRKMQSFWNMKLLGQEWRQIYVELGHFQKSLWRFPCQLSNCRPIAALFSNFSSSTCSHEPFAATLLTPSILAFEKTGSSGDGDELIRSARSNPGPNCTGRARAYSMKPRFKMVIGIEDLKAAKAENKDLLTN